MVEWLLLWAACQVLRSGLCAMNRFFSASSAQYQAIAKTDAFNKAFADAKLTVNYDDTKKAMQNAVKILQQDQIAIPLFQHEADYMLTPSYFRKPEYMLLVFMIMVASG